MQQGQALKKSAFFTECENYCINVLIYILVKVLKIDDRRKHCRESVVLEVRKKKESQ